MTAAQAAIRRAARLALLFAALFGGAYVALPANAQEVLIVGEGRLPPLVKVNPDEIERVAPWPSALAVVQASQLRDLEHRPALIALTLHDFKSIERAVPGYTALVTAFKPVTWRWQAGKPPASFPDLLSAIEASPGSIALVGDRASCDLLLNAFRSGFSSRADVSEKIAIGLIARGKLAVGEGSLCVETLPQKAVLSVSLRAGEALGSGEELPEKALPKTIPWARGNVILRAEDSVLKLYSVETAERARGHRTMSAGRAQ